MARLARCNALRAASVLAVLLTLGRILRADEAPLDIGSHRQLFVDEYLVAHLRGLELRLHPPRPREVVLVRDKPWEGSGSDFERLIREGGIIRLYYMANDITKEDGTEAVHRPYVACCVESTDGIHWTRPDLGIFAFNGSKHNNIVWAGPANLDNFTPFQDPNPNCPPSERYKATMSYGFGKLFALKSPDGIHWSYLSAQPIITHGTFDTQNNAFWDPLRKHYWCYLRGFHERNGDLHTQVESWKAVEGGIRDVRVSTSPDFRTWTEPRLIQFVDSPDEALYTNQIEPYYRAPELFVGFPTRYVDRQAFSPATMEAMPDPSHRKNRMKISSRYGTVVTDGQFMTSRDGYLFHRWDETFIPPGPQRKDNWLYGDGYQSLGLIETAAEDPTAPPELSCYAGEDEWKHATKLRRFTLRVDGFVSVHARQKTGVLISKTLVFSGKALTLNFSTSAGGSIFVELQDPTGRPLPGFTQSDCDEVFGDTLNRTVSWHDGSDLSRWSGRPIRLRLVMNDADLYSLKFQ